MFCTQIKLDKMPCGSSLLLAVQNDLSDGKLVTCMQRYFFARCGVRKTGSCSFYHAGGYVSLSISAAFMQIESLDSFTSLSDIVAGCRPLGKAGMAAFLFFGRCWCCFSCFWSFHSQGLHFRYNSMFDLFIFSPRIHNRSNV